MPAGSETPQGKLEGARRAAPPADNTTAPQSMAAPKPRAPAIPPIADMISNTRRVPPAIRYGAAGEAASPPLPPDNPMPDAELNHPTYRQRLTRPLAKEIPAASRASGAMQKSYPKKNGGRARRIHDAHDNVGPESRQPADRRPTRPEPAPVNAAGIPPDGERHVMG